MSDKAYGSLYSIFVFLLVFSIINFYAKKIKEEKAWQKELTMRNENKILRQDEEHKIVHKLFMKRFLFCESNDYCDASHILVLRINNFN
jgi:hypothetical protein